MNAEPHDMAACAQRFNDALNNAGHRDAKLKTKTEREFNKATKIIRMVTSFYLPIVNGKGLRVKPAFCPICGERLTEQESAAKARGEAAKEGKS